MNDRKAYHIEGILIFCNTNSLEDLRFAPPTTVFSSLSASLAFGLIDPAAEPAILVVGLGTTAIVVVVVVVVVVVSVVVVVVSDAGDDVLADCEEVVITV